jgi:hypothetical protein
MAFEERGQRDGDFLRYRKDSGWDVPDDKRAEVLKNPDSLYWREQLAKSAYIVLVFESMRLLTRAFGELTPDTCRSILTLKQFKQASDGEPMSSFIDFRKGSLADGPLTAIGRIGLSACALLWQGYEEPIRNMASRQQDLLRPEWVQRLSEKLDQIAGRISQPQFRQGIGLDGERDAGRQLTDLRHALES